MEKEPKEIIRGEYAIVIIKPIPQRYFFLCEKFNEYPILGGFAFIEKEIIAIGNIQDINIKL